MDTIRYLNVQEDDDRAFLLLAGRLFLSIERPFQRLTVVRVRNWFDQKWLRFSGIGRVPFDHHRASHSGVALDAIHQDRLTFPPFTPNRIVSEKHYGDGPTPFEIHSRWREPSAWNLHRRVEDYAPSLLAVWISTASDMTGRASFMAYSRAPESSPDAWYASFRRYSTEWRLDRVKGVDHRRVLNWLGNDAPTSATVLL